MGSKKLYIFLMALSCLMGIVHMQQQPRRKMPVEVRFKLPQNLAFTHENTDDLEGAECYNTRYKVNGICIPINLCEDVITDYQKGIPPEVCNYKGQTPIACCPRAMKVQIPATISSTQYHSNNHYTTISTNRMLTGIMSPWPTRTSPNVPQWITAATTRQTPAHFTQVNPQSQAVQWQTQPPAQFIQQNQQPANRPVQQTFGQQPANQPLQQIVGQRPVNRPVQQPANRPTQQTFVQQPANRPTQQTFVQQPANRPVQQTFVQQPANRPVQQTVTQRPVQWPSPQPVQPTTTTQTPVRTTSRINGKRISEIYCERYTSEMTDEVVVGGLSLAEAESQTVKTARCIKPSSDGFIVGGSKAEEGEFPHMAAIGSNNLNEMNWNCGGSLISTRFVMSAAHCVFRKDFKPNVIRLGAFALKLSNEPHVMDFGIEASMRHPNYRLATKQHDIGLFQLDRTVESSDYIRPACLWQSIDINYTSAIATGWGLTSDRGSRSNELMKVQLDLISNTRCRQEKLYDFQNSKVQLNDGQVCAGGGQELRDTCQGDSGGPLQITSPYSDCTYYVLGITSYGRSCGYGYAVYTRVSYYLDWIESIVWNEYD